MTKTPDNTSPESWDRFFASSANNAAWKLAELPREQIDTDALLDAAHASAWHWRTAGNVLNHHRALMLLAQAHAVAGLGATALRHADRMRAFFLATPGTPDWELAFVHAIDANAAHAAGDGARHRNSHVAAVTALDAIVDGEDRAIVAWLFANVPTP